jgi:hypothetical protein
MVYPCTHQYSTENPEVLVISGLLNLNQQLISELLKIKEEKIPKTVIFLSDNNYSSQDDEIMFTEVLPRAYQTVQKFIDKGCFTIIVLGTSDHDTKDFFEAKNNDNILLVDHPHLLYLGNNTQYLLMPQWSLIDYNSCQLPILEHDPETIISSIIVISNGTFNPDNFDYGLPEESEVIPAHLNKLIEYLKTTDDVKPKKEKDGFHLWCLHGPTPHDWVGNDQREDSQKYNAYIQDQILYHFLYQNTSFTI